MEEIERPFMENDLNLINKRTAIIEPITYGQFHSTIGSS